MNKDRLKIPTNLRKCNEIEFKTSRTEKLRPVLFFVSL